MNFTFKTFDCFRNYQSITIEMKEFFDRTRKQVIVMIEPDELLVVQPIGRGAVEGKRDVARRNQAGR